MIVPGKPRGSRCTGDDLPRGRRTVRRVAPARSRFRRKRVSGHSDRKPGNLGTSHRYHTQTCAIRDLLAAREGGCAVSYGPTAAAPASIASRRASPSRNVISRASFGSASSNWRISAPANSPAPTATGPDLLRPSPVRVARRAMLGAKPVAVAGAALNFLVLGQGGRQITHHLPRS
jgi:hypothetical protein